MAVKIEHIHFKGWRIEWTELFDKSFNFYIAFDNAIASISPSPDLSKFVINTSDTQEGIELCRQIIVNFRHNCYSTIDSYLFGVMKSQIERLQRAKQVTTDLHQEIEEMSL